MNILLTLFLMLLAFICGYLYHKHYARIQPWINRFGQFIVKRLAGGYVRQTADRVAEIMLEILTAVYPHVAITKPYDVYSVWCVPVRNGTEWINRAKALMIENAQLDTDSLQMYKTIINHRAVEIGAPLRVSVIRPMGRFFIYEVSIIGNLFGYYTPNERADTHTQGIPHDRDF